MTSQTLDRITAFTQLLALFFIIMGSLLVGVGLISLTGGASALASQGEIDEPTRWIALASQGFVHLMMFTVSSMVFILLVEKSDLGADYFPSSRFNPWIAVGFVLVLYVLSTPLISYTVDINKAMELPDSLAELEEMFKRMEEAAGEATKLMIAFDSFGQFVFGLFIIAVLPGVGEELLFRGIIQRKIQTITGSGHAAVWIAAILFSATHFQFYGFVPRLLIGLLLGYYYLWSQNLLVPIFAHFVNNATTVTLMYLYNEGVIDLDVDQAGMTSWIGALVSLVLTIAVLWIFQRWLVPFRPASSRVHEDQITTDE